MPRCPTCYRRLPGGATCPVDSDTAPASLSASQAAGETPPEITGYTVRGLLGAGGFAVVWAAAPVDDPDGAPLIAIKVARDASELATARLAHEARLLSEIGPPVVPALHGTGWTHDGRMYLAMEALGGRTLAAALESLPGPPSLDWAQRMIHAVLVALRGLHERGLVHRDLKPENVFVVADDPCQVRLMDLGATQWASPADSEPLLTAVGTILGTSEYMAPEQLRPGAVLDVRSDVYAFGVLCYELLTLRPPFVGDRASIEHGHSALRPRRPGTLAPVATAIEDVILACLAKPASQRPQSIAEVAARLDEAFAAARTAGPAPVPADQPALLVARRQPAVVAVVDVDVAHDQIAAIIRRHGGFIARQRGRRYVCVFSGLASDDPVTSALAAAARLTGAPGASPASALPGARVALHAARLALHSRRRGPPAVLGVEIDKPEIWLPARDFTGVLLTAELAHTQPDSQATAIAGLAGFFRLSSATAGVAGAGELFGRAALVAAIEDSLRTSLEREPFRPGLCTVLGQAGLGKSRLAHEIALSAGRLVPHADIVAVTMARGDSEGDEAMIRVVRALDCGDRPTVLIIDDAHWASSEALDLIENATLDRHGQALWVMVTALPRLEEMRTRWGSRASRHHRELLRPLPEADAVALAARLLEPAEYPPVAFLERLAGWSGGIPQILVGLVAELKRSGVVRRHAQGEGWQVVTADIDELPARATSQWLATRQLAEMPPELAAFVRMCAVLGTTFSADELRHVQDEVDQRGGAGSPVDTAVGLADLVARGMLRPGQRDDHVFTSPALQDAVYKLLAARDHTTLHGYAAEYWRSFLISAAQAAPDRAASSGILSHDEALARYARHAGAAGWRAEAAASFVTLGEQARLAHRHVAADSFYSAALRYTRDQPDLAARALAGRGQVRTSLHRISEAIADLGAARQHAEERGDARRVIELLLDEATAADWASDWDAAARSTLARGRTEWRQGRVPSAIELFHQAVAQADTAGDASTVIVAKLLLAPALVWNGQLGEAERVFQDTLDLCVRTSDRFHQCAVLANRMFLWTALRKPAQAEEDLRQAMRLARELGNPAPERAATHNLAELLYRSGEQEESLALARRSRALQERFLQNAPEDALLLARIHASREEYDEARGVLDWLERAYRPDTSDPVVYALFRAVKLSLPDAHRGASNEDAWDALLCDARESIPAEELIEVLWWRARAALAMGHEDKAAHALTEARTYLADSPIWIRRLEALSVLIGDARQPMQHP